jgi:hypothetical protein
MQIPSCKHLDLRKKELVSQNKHLAYLEKKKAYPSSLFFAMSKFNWPIIQKNYGGSPKYEVLFWSMGFFPFDSPIGERWTTFAKAYGIKVRLYWEYVGEHIGNLRKILKTHWEFVNILKTWREHNENLGNVLGTHCHSKCWHIKKNICAYVAEVLQDALFDLAS